MSARRTTDTENATAADNTENEQLTEASTEITGISADLIHAGASGDVSLPAQVADNLISREFVMEWSNSLAGMHTSPETATWSVDDSMQAIFQSRTRYSSNAAERVDVRQGDLSKVCLVGMKITKVDSSFPCNLALCIAGARGNCYSNSGEQFAAHIAPNEKNHLMNKVVVTTSPFVNSAYMQMYPGMTSKNLRTEGIMKVPGENYCFVDQHHPIVEMINENSEVLQIDMADAQLIDGRWLKVSQSVADRCLDNLETQLTDYLPVTDLTQFAATIHRMHGAEWISTDEVADNLTQASMIERMMTTNRRLTVCVQMTYSFM